jgi:LSD1 subclass zinc finger protein
MIRVRCSHCEKMLTVPDAAAGKMVRCPECQTMTRAPAQGVTAEAPQIVEPIEELEEELEERPRRRPRRDDDVEDDRPRRRRRRDEEEEDEEDDDRPRRRRPRYREAEGFSLCDTVGLDYTTQTNLFVLIAIILNVVSWVLVENGQLLVGLLLVPPTVFFFIWGCCAYARMKNRSELLGLFGFLGLIGLIVLICIPRIDEW